MRTYADLIDRLRAYVGNDYSEQKSAPVLRAAVGAMQRIGTKHEWAYYKTYAKMVFSASYDTGTIEFDYTGGSSERLLTLTGGTFPDWVGGYGTIVLESVHYDIARRLSPTTATLKPLSNPGADIPAGTTFMIYRNRYDLPSDFISMRKPIQALDNRRIVFQPINVFIAQRNWSETTGQPYMFTVLDNGYGQKQIMLWPPPAEVSTAEYEYRRLPLAPVVQEESRGTVALTSGSTTVTGTSTMFTQAMVGAVLRVSYDSKKPTAFDSVEPPESEYLVESVESTTSLTLTAAATTTVSKRGYTLSSRIDVEEGAMFNLLVQMGYKQLRIALGKNMTNEEAKDYDLAEREAKSADGQSYLGSDVANQDGCLIGVAGSPFRNLPTFNG